MMFTVITVVYNSISTIGNTIESVLSQTYTDYEYLIIDGNSTDGTSELISSYKDSRIKHIREKDKGIFDAMNKGIKLAKGQFLSLLNSDDIYSSNVVLESVNDIILKKSIFPERRILIGKMNLVTTRGVKCHTPELKRWRYQMALNHPTWFVNKCIYDEIGDYDSHFRVSGDFDFAQRCILSNVMIEAIDLVMVDYSLSGISSTSIRGYFEDFTIRRKNQTVDVLTNLYLLIRFLMEFLLSKFK
jgi:glycosyltransferase involved in cell wall biosynthesis